MKNAMVLAPAAAALLLGAVHTSSALPMREPGAQHPQRRGVPASGSVALAEFECAAFVWDSVYYSYSFLPGFADVKQAEEAAMAQCVEGYPDNGCEVKTSWCGANKCVAAAFSYDWQWYAFNPNPVTATKAGMYALNECTQNVCDALAWEERCSTAAPVCYLEFIICGTEYVALSYNPDTAEQNFTTASLDFGASFDTDQPATVLTANITVLSMNLPLNQTLPMPALPLTHSDHPDASMTDDPAYVPTPTETPSAAGTDTATEEPTVEITAESTSTAAEDATTSEPTEQATSTSTTAAAPATTDSDISITVNAQ